ncbi:MAG TPA: SRPBCC family protein [Nocardioides sp.]|nr:SRPBCC family protein [Nocardioides sp.]
MPTCEPVDLTFFDSAPQRFEQSWDVPRPAETFFADDLVADALHWCRGLRLDWRSPAPYGVGAKRHVSLLGLMRADEHFFLWEEGRRFAFHFTRVNLPIFTSFAEYYEVEPTGPDSCRFTWKVAVAPSPLGRPGGPLNALLIGRLFKDTTRYVAGLTR